MEESEKRRERLKAMRMEAAQAGVNYGSETSGFPTGGLSNPFVEDVTASMAPPQHYPPRFDFYTDPMAAFSGNRRGNMSSQVSQGNYNIPPGNIHHSVPPGPVYQNPVLNSSGQRMPPGPVYQNPVLDSSGQRTFDAPRPQFNQAPPRSPVVAFRPFSGPQGNPPGAWGGSSGRHNYSSPPNLYRGNRFTSPSFVQGESPLSFGRARGRDQRYANNSHYSDSGHGYSRSHNSGRGRDQWAGSNTNPGSSSSSRRGTGSHGSVSAELRPDLYYSKEMVEDPWKSLIPVIWKDVEAQNSNRSWLPKSITNTKKAKVSPESSKISIPQPSLAEYLAASLNDPTDEAVDDEQST